MANQYLVFFVEGPSCRIVVDHCVFHVLNYLVVYVFELPLPRHTLIYSRPREGMREPIESIVEHIVIVNELNKITVFQLGQQLHCRENLLRLLVQEAFIHMIK